MAEVRTALVVTNDFPPRVGGIESFVADLCELLDRDVVVLTSGPPGAERTDRDRGYQVVRYAGPVGGSVLLPTRAVARRASALLAETGATRVVFGAAAPLGLLAPALRAAGARHLLGLTHGHEVWWARVPGARQVLHRIGDSCDHLGTISDFTTARIGPALSPAARGRLVRLTPPVDLDRFRPTPSTPTVDAPGPTAPASAPAAPAPDTRPRCVAVGRFVRQKGFLTLVEAWAHLLRGQRVGTPRPELVLVGDGPQRLALEARAVALGIRDDVRLTGVLPRERVLAELQRARVFALPVSTRFAGLNPEGLGLAALEAAACGLPVVTGRSGGAPETVREGETGFVVEPGDVAGLAGRLRELLEDPDRARRMGERGRAHVAERFGSDRVRSSLREALDLD